MAALDRETLLDLTVNVVPLAIILLFAVVGLMVAPIGWGSLFTEIVELGLLAVPFVVLAVVSYLAGRAIMLDEEAVEAAADHRSRETNAPGTVPASSASEDDSPEATAEPSEATAEPSETATEPVDDSDAGKREPSESERAAESDRQPETEPASRSEAEGES